MTLHQAITLLAVLFSLVGLILSVMSIRENKRLRERQTQWLLENHTEHFVATITPKGRRALKKLMKQADKGNSKGDSRDD